jgi:hypothetical protein
MKKFPKARRIAVENFSSGLTVLDMATSMNLSMDTRLYKWNAQTVAAIKYVINNRKAYNNNVKTV